MAQSYSMPDRRGIPNWLAALLILLFLAGAAYFAYEQGYKGKGSGGVETVAVEGPANPPRNGGGWFRSLFGGGNNNNSRNNRPAVERSARQRQPDFRPDIPEGVSRSNMSRAIYARKGNVAVRGLADDRPSDPWSITIEFLDAQTWVPREQVNLARTARVLTASPRHAQHAQVTEEQKKQLLEIQRDVELTAEEKAQFESMMRAWDQARRDRDQREAIAGKILAAVEQSATKHLPEARERVRRRAEQINKVLTADQLRKAREGPPERERNAGNRQPSRAPATRPATRPATLPAALSAPSTRPATLPAG